MKKLFLLALIFGATVSFAAPKTKQAATFYGVDFSQVNVVAAQDTDEQFMNVFRQINDLVMNEAAKYDPALLGVEATSTQVDKAKERVSLLTGTNFRNQADRKIDYAKIIAAYPKVDGAVLLIVAIEMNKATLSGTYHWLIYDGQSGAIRSEGDFTGKAQGFGLRNFWAGSLYSGMKKALK